MATPADTAPGPGSYAGVAALYAQAKALKEKEEREKAAGSSVAAKRNAAKAGEFSRAWAWSLGFFGWLLFITATGIYFFTKGFLLTRLVLDSQSSCILPPSPLPSSNLGTPHSGCWHPKTFDKAVIILIDALRYDFTVPIANTSTSTPLACHNALPFLHDTALAQPKNAFLLPFIADPPTTTLQRLKGLTTGTLPTFIDAGSNFAGTAIEEDNLLIQLRDAGRRIAHLGDDTWTALFPGYFEEDISHAYDSFNVWDLHTVDDGVTEHVLPLLRPKPAAGGVGREDWDVLIAHFLGVDHAGHRYGPDHPAMAAKLAQMDKVLRDVVAALDDDTLLVVMGDHGMDSKGDHGGESDDEVEAALWMYSKRGIFGRTDPANVAPPATAKERSINQIDLVPTLALLLGIPIPFNNLGRPMEEAFVGARGTDWGNLAAVARMTAAGIKRYQKAYFEARGMEESTGEGSPKALWDNAQRALELAASGKKDRTAEWKTAYQLLTAYQKETLDVCRGLWARFDVVSMCEGIGILAGALLILIIFSRNVANDDGAVVDPELEKAEQQLEMEGMAKGEDEPEPEDFTKSVVTGAFIGVLAGGSLGISASFMSEAASLLNEGLLCAAVTSLLGALAASMGSSLPFRWPLPSTLWSWLALLFPLLLGAGFGANSFTIWEDQILLFFLSTFGLLALMASLRIADRVDRLMGVTQSLLFLVLGWLASLSRLCRDEQLPFCKSTYYASDASSTSAPWQLLLPYLVALVLPSVIKSYLVSTRNYEGLAPLFIGVALRLGLLLNALFWTLDAADDADWLPFLPPGSLKSTRVAVAQTVIALGCVAGPIAYSYATPCVNITSSTTTAAATSTSTPAGDAAVATRITAPKPRTTITILGFANTHGSLYLLLLSSLLLPLLLVQKPMGSLALSLFFWQILCLCELVDVLRLRNSPVAPVVLALLADLHFFKTGHQATLASVQWDSAFIALRSVTYPWAPLLVGANTFGAFVLGALATPMLVLWKREARTGARGVVGEVAGTVGWFVGVFVGWTLGTSVVAGWLRRHLMLYRVFSPRWMVGAATGLVVEMVVVGVVGWGVWRNCLSVAEVFGWA